MKRNKYKIALLAFSILLTILSGIRLTQTNNELYKANLKYEKLQQNIAEKEKQGTTKHIDKNQTYSSVDINAPAYKGADIEKLKEQVSLLEFKKMVYSTTKEDFKKIITGYVGAKYNYNGTSKGQCENVIKAIAPYADECVYDDIRKEMNELLHGNGNISDNFKHTGELVNVYLRKITKAGTNSNSDVTFNYIDTYMLEGYLKIKYNNGGYKYSNIILSISYDKPEWKITSDVSAGYCFLNLNTR